jgi:ribosomal protein L32
VENSGAAGQGSSTRFDHVEDPVYTTTKGRPGEKRKQSGLHLKSSKVVKCTVCGSVHHTAPSCPSKLTPALEPKEIDFFRDMV